MEIPFERWQKAIGERRSRRRFHWAPPLLPLNDWIWRVCRNFRPFPDVEAVLVNKPAERILKGAIGPYGKIRGAPAFIALLANAGCRTQEHVGYTGEGIVLEATVCGLDTCWVGGSFRRDAVRPMATAYVGERVFAVIPIGYGAERRSFTEKLFTGFGRAHRRKSLPELLIDTNESELAPWIRVALEAGRLAPSAYNRQPWRFTTTQNTITISVGNAGRDHGVSKRLDCGIAMLHIEVAALAQGVTGKWQLLRDPYVASFTRTEL
jgi:nitroreductase